MGFLQPETLASNKLRLVPSATLWQFGVLQSRMHAAWTKYTTGRLKSDFQYSISIVYNNFPWPEIPAALAPNKPLTPAHKAQAAIEVAAQAVLDARAQYFPAASLADLYDPLVMPVPLLKAHQKLDAAVDKAYQLCGGKKSYASDAERVAFLFERYQQLTSLLPVAGKKPKKYKPKSPPAL